MTEEIPELSAEAKSVDRAAAMKSSPRSGKLDKAAYEKANIDMSTMAAASSSSRAARPCGRGRWPGAQ